MTFGGSIAVVAAAVTIPVALPRSVHARQDAEGLARPAFRTGTTLVEMTMIALDHRGRPVVDLEQQEISLTEDGQRREIALRRCRASRASPRAAPAH